MTAGGEPTVSGAGDDDVTAELARTRAERDALAGKLDRRAKRAVQGGRLRTVFVGFLVALSILFIPLTATVTWAHQTVLNTDRYVATVGPIASDPAVVDSLAAKITDQIYTAIDPEQKITEALNAIPNAPKALDALAGPLANGIKGRVDTGVTKALSTQQFHTIWVTANRVAHTQIVAVLRGDSAAIQTVNGEVVLNLVPLLNSALQQVQPTIDALLGKNITLPTISSDEVPAAACKKISTALGRPVPATCGQIPLFPASSLDSARQAVTKFDRWTVGLLILTPLLIIGAVLLSRRRRRTALQLAVGGTLGLVVVRRLAMYMEGRIEGAVKPANRAAADAIVSQVLHRFYDVTLVLLIVGLVVVAVLLLTGPYRWARTMRAGTRRGAVAAGTATASATRSLTGRTQDDATRDWIRGHRGALQIGGAAVAVVLILLVSLSPLWLLIIGVLLAGYLLGLARITRDEEPPEDQGSSPPGADEPIPAGPPASRPG